VGYENIEGGCRRLWDYGGVYVGSPRSISCWAISWMMDDH